MWRGFPQRPETFLNASPRSQALNDGLGEMLDVTRPAARLAILVACSAAASGCGGSARDSSSTRARKSHELGRRAAPPARPGPPRARPLATLRSPAQPPAGTLPPPRAPPVLGALA